MEMFRSWEATEPLDKVYALLEFSSDAYNAPDLCPDYTISKYQLARKLLELSFPGCLVHQQSEDTDLVSFQVEGFILGVIGLSRRRHIKFWKFDSVKLMNSDQGHVEFMVNSKAWELFQRGWELPVSNERKLSSGDLVCLLRGASYPTILKYSAATNFYEGECTVDMLAAPQPKFSVEQEFGDEIDTTAWAAALQTLEAESEGLMTFKLAWHPFRKPEPSQVSEFNFSPNNWQVQWEVAIASIAQIAAEKAVASQNGLENTYHWTCRQITELRVQYSGDREKIEAGQSEKNITVHKAAAGGFLESLKILLEMKVDVDVRDEFKATPLHWAAYYGHEEIVKLLLQAKATVDVVHKDGTTPLIDAAGKGHARIVEILLDAGACPNGLAAQREAPIFAPAISGRVDIVNLLLKAGADPNVRSAEIENAAPLHFAAEVGHTNIVEALLAGKAELNIRADCGCTPLHKAAQQGKFEVAKLLLHSGAEVDLQDEHGVTPLHFASQGGYTDIVRALLQKNADKGARTDAGSTPLSLAYISPDQNKETIELLEGWPTCYIGSKTRTEQQESELSHTLRPTLHGSAGKERKGRKCPTMAGMFRGLQNFR
jgi:ankyrin repeat protein